MSNLARLLFLYLFIFVEFAQILSLLSSTHLGSVDDSSFTSTHTSKKKGEQIFDLKKRVLVKSGSCSPRKKKKTHSGSLSPKQICPASDGLETKIWRRVLLLTDKISGTL